MIKICQHIIITSLHYYFLYSNGHDECFRGSHMHSLTFHCLQHTVRPCSTFRWKGIATSANRSPYMYSCVTTFLSCSVPLGTTHSALNSRRRQKKLAEVTDVTVLQNRHVALYACSETNATWLYTHAYAYMYYNTRIISLIDFFFFCDSKKHFCYKEYNKNG